MDLIEVISVIIFIVALTVSRLGIFGRKQRSGRETADDVSETLPLPSKEEILQKMSSRLEAAEADARVREYLGEAAPEADRARSYRYTRVRPERTETPVPRDDGLWLPATGERKQEAAHPPAHEHRYTQGNRNPLGDLLPDRINESVQGQEGVWGDEGHSEHYRSVWLDTPRPPEETEVPRAALDISPQDVLRGVIWAAVLAEPRGRGRQPGGAGGRIIRPGGRR
ncbi:MAG: hypothetical protein LBQ16_06840 [Gracilibacteraceae bacterium]|jgi:hypothetical protein|nr:hypothetical protein [Gracilibacteraceae bacterium]